MDLPPFRLSSEISKMLENHEGGVPPILYHYTGVDGLYGILSSREIWISDLRYMNDSSEMLYLSKLFSERYSVWLEANRSTVTPLVAEAMKKVLRFGLHSSTTERDHMNINEIRTEVFSASFCENGDLLSQWRGYTGGNGGGYSLGIDFLHSIPHLNRRCEIKKVIYDYGLQCAILDRSIEQFSSYIGNLTSRDEYDFNREVSDAAASLFGSLWKLTSVFKDPQFSEEREWRLIHEKTRYYQSIDGECPDFRRSGNNLIPYLKVSFKHAIERSMKNEVGLRFPFREVIVGPGVSADLNATSIRQLFYSINSQFDVSIVPSKIPLR